MANITTVPVLHINEDNLLEWKNARNARTEDYINSGTGSWQLKESDGTVVASGSLAYEAASNGYWYGTLDQDDAANLVEGERYWLEMTLADGLGAEGFRRIEHVAGYHGGED